MHRLQQKFNQSGYLLALVLKNFTSDVMLYVTFSFSSASLLSVSASSIIQQQYRTFTITAGCHGHKKVRDLKQFILLIPKVT